MTISAREQRVIRLGLVGAVLIVAYVLAIDPLLTRWTNVSQKLARVTQQIEDAKAGAASAESETELRQLLTETARLASAEAPLAEHTALLMQQVQQLPGYQDLEISRVEGLPVRPAEDYLRTAVSLQFGGSLNDLQKFLRALDRARPRLLVDRFSLSTHSKDSELVEGHLVIFAFSVPDLGSDTDQGREAQST